VHLFFRILRKKSVNGIRMKTYWGKEKFGYNNELCFSVFLKKGEGKFLRIIAKDIYNLFVNGEFICYGPARAGYGASRVDVVDISSLLTEEKNKVEIFVQSNKTKTLCFSSADPYFGCEITDGDVTLKDTDDFDCFYMADKVVKVEKMSFQRTFLEVYKMKEDRRRRGDAFVPIEKVEVPTPILLERLVGFSKNRRKTAKLYGEGSADDGGEITWENDYSREQLTAGRRYFAFTRDKCEVALSYELDKLRYFQDGKERKYRYKAYAFENIEVGKFFLNVTAKKKTDVYLVYDDLLIDGIVKFNREQIIHGLKWTIEEGKYQLNSNEVYQAKYVTLVYDGDLDIDEVGIIAIENPDVEVGDFKTDDREINQIIDASIRTFKHNAYDLPTDCASRERAGYLCDSFFTARAEKFFTGQNKVERNMLENYLYFKNEVFTDGGVIPMCYPSCPKEPDDYIPNWILWYIVQLGDCLYRTGDCEFIQRHKNQVYKSLKFFEKYENEYGLLENLDGWVFVEWSKANDFVDGVNFPSNMLYAGALKSAGRMFNDTALMEKSEKVRRAVKTLSYDGDLFRDNALREDGKLVLTDNVSETCQNYAVFFEIITKEEDEDFYKKLDRRFGALDNTGRKVWESNMFIGFILRLAVLHREGKYELLIKESKEVFIPMTKVTGTVWEHFAPHSSCNHGFGAIVGGLVYDSYQKIRKGGKTHAR